MTRAAGKCPGGRLGGQAGQQRHGRGKCEDPAHSPLEHICPHRGCGPRIAAMADLTELKAMIEQALPGAEVEVIDEGGGDHLRAIVTASQFEGLSRIDQHRLVKAAVKNRFDDGTIHALSLKTSPPD